MTMENGRAWGLGKRAFPSLTRMEDEIIRRGLSLLGGSERSGGIFTSGGTESILLAIKAAREWARRSGKKRPFKILLSETAPPAFNRAASLMEMRLTASRCGTATSNSI